MSGKFSGHDSLHGSTGSMTLSPHLGISRSPGVLMPKRNPSEVSGENEREGEGEGEGGRLGGIRFMTIHAFFFFSLFFFSRLAYFALDSSIVGCHPFFLLVLVFSVPV